MHGVRKVVTATWIGGSVGRAARTSLPRGAQGTLGRRSAQGTARVATQTRGGALGALYSIASRRSEDARCGEGVAGVSIRGARALLGKLWRLTWERPRA